MKKALAILLIALHLFFTTGVKVDMHFCGDSLKDVSISKVSSGIQSCCKTKESKDAHTTCKKASCCANTSATLLSLNSFNTEQVKIVSTGVHHTAVILSDINSYEKSIVLPTQTISPPILQGRAVYITTSSFCFYG